MQYLTLKELKEGNLACKLIMCTVENKIEGFESHTKMGVFVQSRAISKIIVVSFLGVIMLGNSPAGKTNFQHAVQADTPLPMEAPCAHHFQTNHTECIFHK